MTTPPKELSPERCHELREGGFLRVLVNLLHEHTFELQVKPEADFNMEMFLMDFNRKSELRARSSQQLRTIVEHTAKNEDELKILGWLEALRKYIERLYNFTIDWKAMIEDPSKLRECTVQLTKLAEDVEEAIVELRSFTLNDANCPFFEQFGGVFVIVDYLRAQTRFNAKCHQFEPDQIDASQFLGVANDFKIVPRLAISILYNLVYVIDSNDIRLFLGNSRSLHEIMVGILMDAYDDDDLPFVQLFCHLLHLLYYTDDPIHPTVVGPSTSHLKNCGVIQCLAKIGIETKDPQTLYFVILALEASLALDRRNALEFVSIDGAVDILIDVLVPSKEKQGRGQRGWCLRISNFFRLFSSVGRFFGQCQKIDPHGGAGPEEKDEDVKNSEWYKDQRCYSIFSLGHISRHLSTRNRLDGRLLAIYEARDFAAILVHHLEQITSINESLFRTWTLLAMLKYILVSSENQRRKFPEIVNGKEVVKRFESSDDEDFARISKRIGKMFE